MDEYRELLNSILAVIHGDGGRRQSKVGTAAATCEAQEKYTSLILERDEWKRIAEAGERSKAFQRIEEALADVSKERDEWKRRAERSEAALVTLVDRVREAGLRGLLDLNMIAISSKARK